MLLERVVTQECIFWLLHRLNAMGIIYVWPEKDIKQNVFFQRNSRWPGARGLLP